jgi:acyl-CoA synthetase (AMP-forming)/AMP-acid ligase II
LLRQHASQRPEHLALVTPVVRVTWRQLHADAMQASAALHALGVERDGKVCILAPNGYEWMRWAYGAAGIGAVVVPANTRFRSAEFAYQLKSSDTHTLFVQPAIGDTDYLGIVAELVPEIRDAPPGRWRSAAFPRLRHVVSLAPEPSTRVAGLQTLSTCLADALTAEETAAVERAWDAVSPCDPAIIQYTSGTTAFPKGAVLSHASTARNAYEVNRRLCIDGDDRIFVPGPFFHVGGSTLGMLLGLVCGATIFAIPKFDPAVVLRTIEEERITVYSGVDSLFLTLLKHPGFRREALASVRKGWIASSPEIVRMVQRDMGLEGTTNVYGISEASPNIAICAVDEPMDVRAETCGRPHPGCEVRVVDPATGVDVPAGARGEILFRGYSLMLGYYGNPDETAKAIDRDGWLHTGDQGLLRPSGHLEYHGRLKDMLRVGGENLAPAEVEEVLCQHPKVRQAAVVGIPDDRLIEVAAAVIELKEGEQCSADELVAFCKARLASFKVPRQVAFVPAMPMTGSGKIQKFRLVQELFATQKARDG